MADLQGVCGRGAWLAASCRLTGAGAPAALAAAATLPVQQQRRRRREPHTTQPCATTCPSPLPMRRRRRGSRPSAVPHLLWPSQRRTRRAAHIALLLPRHHEAHPRKLPGGLRAAQQHARTVRHLPRALAAASRPRERPAGEGGHRLGASLERGCSKRAAEAPAGAAAAARAPTAGQGGACSARRHGWQHGAAGGGAPAAGLQAVNPPVVSCAFEVGPSRDLLATVQL